MLFKIAIFLIFSLGFSAKNLALNSPAKFKLGNEKLLENMAKLKGNRIALITNQTGIDTKGRFFLDLLVNEKINVKKVFSPEHGIRGNENYSDVDFLTGVPIVSLFGSKYAPSEEELSDVDILIYDIQDVGSRFYTYTSTLYYCIESALKSNKKFIVCDRPMVINPDYADGFMLDTLYKSFVGSVPVPVCYGMTCGELALYLNQENFGKSNLIEVSEMEGYNRDIKFITLDLPWIKPSPSMFSYWTAVSYPATCFLEGTNVSEGRGTPKPFEYFGAPWINADTLANELNSYNPDGVTFSTIKFTPSQKISDHAPKYFEQECGGIFIVVNDVNKFEPVKAAIAILVSLKKLFPEFKFNSNNFIDKLAGTDKLRVMVDNLYDYGSIVNSWEDELKQFKEKRKSILLYN